LKSNSAKRLTPKNKTDSEAKRDKQSNDTMLGGLSLLMWITWSDKGNNGMTKG